MREIQWHLVNCSGADQWLWESRRCAGKA